ncbi:hypothetical protein [Campylobacter curvus]|uniref:hypothetical protein n=1 Tax=Campylobacter curvus TaxID=200 RepID=UPI0001593CCD|nr:hypothetical protein [Campylobacter curvus]EJP75330.1 hypothetical protein HMPREF1139_0112 [Campylobacter sp. FOBRC14]
MNKFSRLKPNLKASEINSAASCVYTALMKASDAAKFCGLNFMVSPRRFDDGAVCEEFAPQSAKFCL